MLDILLVNRVKHNNLFQQYTYKPTISHLGHVVPLSALCAVLPVPGAPISCHPGDGPDISALPSSVVEGERERD